MCPTLLVTSCWLAYRTKLTGPHTCALLKWQHSIISHNRNPSGLLHAYVLVC